MPRPALRLALALLLIAGTAAAAPLRREDVPEELQQWIDWALHGETEAACSRLEADSEHRECFWPTQIELTLDDHGGRFTQLWNVQRRAWVPLPGDGKSWPQDVTVDGAPAPVIEQESQAVVQLDVGTHRVSGRFLWDRLPEMLPIPPRSGLVTLPLRGAAVPFPERDGEGHLWLQRRETAAEDSDRVDVTVHRLIDDDIPLQLETQIQLEVSGKGREVLLGPALPAGFVPMSLGSPLPARLEPDGRLRMQVRPGRWTIGLSARHDGPAPALQAPTPSESWASHEVWVFRAHPELRLVTVEGADAIDPQQTDLPGDWRQLPAYLMPPGSELRLVERRRGDSDAPPDQLSLSRTLWLDFDGGGYSLRDQVSGTLTRAWRLDMGAPIVLGRVAVNGSDQFITRLSADAPAGVEIRSGALDLTADSRLDGAQRTLPAVGWLHDFQSVSGQLQLPPGWRLLHASGVDQARPTWIATWTLLDLFVVLITALATAHLFGWPWGLLALAAIGLSYTESRAPQFIWLAVLAAEALVRVVPAGRAQRVLRCARLATRIALVLIAVPFLIAQLRQAIYPSLERPYGFSSAMRASSPLAAAAPESEAGRAYDRLLDEAVAAKRPHLGASSAPQRFEYAQVDPSSVVQTGPGLPAWSWTNVSLDWSGPVDRDQSLHLYLLPPAVNLATTVLRTLLLALLIACLLGAPLAGLRRGTPGLARLLAFAGAAPARADFPPDDMLNTLRQRLTEPPDCAPACASLSRLDLEITPQTLRARLQIDVGAPTALPLPGQAQQWLPQTVIIDGQPASALQQRLDGALWLRLEAGIHDVLLEGPLPARDTVQVLLPFAPGRAEAKVEGWTLDGLHPDGTTDDSLQLTRSAPVEGAAAPLQADQLPPFARIERTLRLGLTWRAETRVVRLTPPDSALVLSVPLLPGESVTSAEVRVADGRAQINLSPGAQELSWQSTLTAQSPLALQAPSAVAWVEQWQLDASPVWHVEARGIAAVLDPTAAPLRTWRPWPGESLTLDIVRPQGVPGQTLTIDSSELSVAPGLRATDVGLTLQVRSSRGAQHRLTLPDGAELLTVTTDGGELPVRQEGRAVVLPVNPGAQRFDLTWREPRGIASRYATSSVDLGAASVDARLRLTVPPDRWVLFAGGPRLGPAVLFWSTLPILLLIAFGLGRLRLTPLGTLDWLLLGIGLTQVPVAAAAVVAGWLLALGWRRQRAASLGAAGFDLLQVVLVAW
ncbi:MAG: hypothetical protein SF182_29655, partial [Deltaproteobacteria bacterium]|nr:hypothetical protein [Deltaproteobacteria bacterium]